MNTLPLLLILAQWTALLALGWIAHSLLRQAHSRWRVILWRGVLCAGLLVPMMPFAPLHVFNVPINETSISPVEIPSTLPSASAANLTSTSHTIVPPPAQTVAVNNIVKNPTSQPSPRIAINIPWQKVILIAWALVAAFGAFRLVRLQWQLNSLMRHSRPANPALREQAREIQDRLGVKQPIDVRVSDSIISAFACGLSKPTILISQKLAGELPSGETSVLLAHEIAHFRRHDLFWCVGWRWMQALFWFHPLVWKIPAAHNLACEQESDRLASGQMPDRSAYPQLLARLALRVLALPDVESRLVLNGAALITKRLNHLQCEKAGNWNWKHSLAGFALVALLFILATGCQISQNPPPSANTPTNTKFKKVLVVVQDQDGKPVAGATLLPTGFRVKGIHSPDAYGWRANDSGPAEKAVTDNDGKAWLKYPVMGIPEEKELTGEIIFKLSHPGFTPVFNQGYSVDTPEPPIQLAQAAHMKISGYFGADRQPVTDVIAVIKPDDETNSENGTLLYHQLSSGSHLIQLMGRLPSGEIVYSDATPFTAAAGQPDKLELEMKPGIRLEGRIDNTVPRPVQNGRVMVSMRPPQYPVSDVIEDFYAADDKYGGYNARQFWHSYRPINADGTFVFESVPPGEADVVVLGDGFASQTTGQLHNRIHGMLSTNGPTMVIPQAFPLTAPATQIEIQTEPTATLEFTARTKSGQPIAGVWVGMYPSAFRMWGPFGWNKNSSEEPFRQIPQLSNLDFSGKTDGNGRLVMSNLPAETRGFEVDDPNYQVPLQDPKGWRDRHVRATFAPGETNVMNMVMEPKGSDYIGTAK